MTDFPRLMDGLGREYILRRKPGEYDEAYRKRAGLHARIGMQYQNIDEALQQIVFIEADRRILTSKVADLRR